MLVCYHRHIPSPQLVPCDLASGAPEESLVALEEEVTIDTTQENRRLLNLRGSSPAVITLISPSTTSLSSADESCPKYKPDKKARSDGVQSTSSIKRQSVSRRLRHTPTVNYPQMSYKRAHEVVQSRKRSATKRRKSPYTNRPPLETNPGWTPLQKAILVRCSKPKQMLLDNI